MFRVRSIALLFVVGLTGCDLLFEEDAPAGAGEKGAKNKADSRSLTAEELDAIIADQESYSYEAYGKRDPFTPFLRLIDSTPQGGPQTALQRYELGEYRMAAAITGIDRPRGMVVDPTGEHYVVEIGDYIGKKWGQVSKIERERIEVTEEYESSDGDLLVTKKSLTPSDGGQGGR